MAYYKAFKKGMICNGKQYAENADFEEHGAESCCKAGMMHFCENPLDTLNYYPLIDDDGELSEFATVEPLAEVKRDKDKCASRKIRIGAKLSLKGFIEAAVNVLIEKTKCDDHKNAASGDSSQLAASGNYSKLAASGYYSQLAASGDSSKLAASGNSSKLAASGYYSKLAASGNSSKLAASGYYSQLAAPGNSSQLAASGDSSQLAASGNYSKLAASGDSSQLAASGYYSQLAASGNSSKLAASGNSSKLAASGDYSQLAMSGKNSVGANIGISGKAKGVMGCWIVLAEWEHRGNEGLVPMCVKVGKIDGETLKADTWYTLKNGEFVEAD